MWFFALLNSDARHGRWQQHCFQLDTAHDTSHDRRKQSLTLHFVMSTQTYLTPLHPREATNIHLSELVRLAEGSTSTFSKCMHLRHATPMLDDSRAFLVRDALAAYTKRRPLACSHTSKRLARLDWHYAPRKPLHAAAASKPSGCPNGNSCTISVV